MRHRVSGPYRPPMLTSMSAPDFEAVIARGVRKLHQVSGLPIAMGGLVTRDRQAMVISELCGTTTQSLLRLSVSTGDGLGGKALALGRCATVTDYPVARGITHRYDQAVAPERLRAVVAIPVKIDDAPRAVLYAAARHPVSLGDRFLQSIAPVVRVVERDMMVEQEVRRRLATELVGDRDEPSLSRHEMGEVHSELMSISGSISDDAARTRLLSLCDRVLALAGGPQGEPQPTASGVRLAPRERDVLQQVSRGCTNSETAENLGLLTNTVKAYLKSAMRKLGAANRVQAVYLARQARIIS